MPVVLRLDGLRVQIYPNDHRPPHVHVIGRGGELVFVLNCPTGPLVLDKSYQFSLVEARRIGTALEARLDELCAAWSRLHGDF